MTSRPLVFFHRTTRHNADLILAGGFKDGRGTYLTDQVFEGVFLSDRPLDCNEGANSDALLSVTLPLSIADLEQYEWREEGKTYREWHVPAALLNEHAVVRLIDADDPITHSPT